MFSPFTQSNYVKLLPGIMMKVVAYGDNSLLCEFHLKKDSTVPLHQHAQEQTGYLVSGKMRFFGGEEFIAEPGSGWSFKGGVMHGVEVLEDSVAIEVFSPIRQDYLELAGIHL
jgi:quercetin dioxygenase-like cupin family protein